MNKEKKSFLIKVIKNGDNYSGLIEELELKIKKNFKEIDEISNLIKEFFEKKEKEE